MIKARASGSKVYLYFMKKGRQARHRILRNSCCYKQLLIQTCWMDFEIILPFLRDGSNEGHNIRSEGEVWKTVSPLHLEHCSVLLKLVL